MQAIQSNALWRVLSTCAKFFKLRPQYPRIKGTALPPLTDHIARDIGLTPHDRALLSHHWPSRDTRHPFL